MNKLALLFFIAVSACTGQQNSTTKTMEQTHKYTNALIEETSPYLLQHAHNPVNWQAWNDEALEQAKQEEKLMIISVGYAACHWCHVMEHESFEDSTVATLMNSKYIPIKVDREERPDIDQVYMDASVVLTGSGGWPLNAIALPDGRAVFAGTYFPKEKWLDALEYFAKLWENEPERLLKQAGQIQERAATFDLIPPDTEIEAILPEQINNTVKDWLTKVDTKRGGRIGAPKFPMPNIYNTLLQNYHATGNQEALDFVNTTLTSIANGGIYDQIGGGFARYSVDTAWHVPHFEKMLYDNGQLVSLYSEAYQATKDPLYKRIVEETLVFIEREMHDSSGGFYSSYDADSEGEEGKFYVFSKSEIDELLGSDAAWFCDYYDISEQGNWEHTNVLRIEQPLEKVLSKHNIPASDWENKLAAAKKKVFDYREKRVKPGLDDKVLLSWNSLMLKGYLDAYRAFGEEDYLKMALKNASFIEENFIKDNFRVDRNYKNGKTTINGFLDDYSFTIEAFVALYQITFEEKWLEKAKGLSDYVQAHFYDDHTGLFFYTSNLDKALVLRKKETSDNVIPASNSSMFKGMYALGSYFDNKGYLAKVDRAAKVIQPSTRDSFGFYSNWLQLMQHIAQPPYEVAIVGPNAKQLRKEMDQYFLPNVILLGGETEGKLPLLEYKLIEGKTMIYVCQNKTCKFPVETVEEALKQIKM